MRKSISANKLWDIYQTKTLGKTLTEQIKILYVENDAVDRAALERYIREEQLNFDVNYARTFKEAIRDINEVHYDIALLDYNLENGTALEILKEIETPAIFITNEGDEKIAVEAIQLGAYDYLIKDIEGHYLKLLQPKINKVLNRKKEELLRKVLSQDTDKKMQELETLYEIGELMDTEKSIDVVLVKATELVTDGLMHPEKSWCSILIDGRKYNSSNKIDLNNNAVEFKINICNEVRGNIRVGGSEDVDILETEKKMIHNIAVRIGHAATRIKMQENKLNEERIEVIQQLAAAVASFLTEFLREINQPLKAEIKLHKMLEESVQSSSRIKDDIQKFVDRGSMLTNHLNNIEVESDMHKIIDILESLLKS